MRKTTYPKTPEQLSSESGITVEDAERIMDACKEGDFVQRLIAIETALNALNNGFSLDEFVNIFGIFLTVENAVYVTSQQPPIWKRNDNS